MQSRYHQVRFVHVACSLCLLVASIGWLDASSTSWADDPASSDRPSSVPAEASSDVDTESVDEDAATVPTNESRRRKVANYLSGATFTGQFTIAGKSDSKPESYTISSCEPLDQADLYRMKVKIRYGDVDGEFPMDLQIKWADSTPVITLDAIWIPGLGTFSARVLMHQDRYAGTWQHDEKGGHLFGTISKAP